MAKFDPENPTYPSGCYAVVTPDNKVFNVPNNTTAPSMDFNRNVYFGPKPGSNAYQMLSDEVIKEAIRCPSSPWVRGMIDMMMLTPSRKFVPAHLPNIFDSVGRVDVVEAIEKLHKGKVLYNDSHASSVIPYFLENDIDPTPIVEVEGPVYPLTVRKVHTEFACYADGSQVFYLHSPITEILLNVVTGTIEVSPFLKYMSVCLDTRIEEGEDSFELGSVVVLWNARGVTRPCFKSNFQRFVHVHKPMIFAICEARVSEITFEKVAKDLGYDLGWAYDESVGLMGGIALLWDKKKVVGDEVLVNASQTCPLRVLATLKPAKLEEEGDA